MKSVPSSDGLIPMGAARSEGSEASAVSNPSSAPPASSSNDTSDEVRGVERESVNGLSRPASTARTGSLPAPGKVRSEADGGRSGSIPIKAAPELADFDLIERLQQSIQMAYGIRRIHLVSRLSDAVGME